MAKTRGKKALYEVISQSQRKLGSSKLGRQVCEPKAAVDGTEGEKETSEAPEQLSWPKKPRIVQLNAGRIELSVPYQLAVAILLGIVLLALVSYRLGQRSTSASEPLQQPVEQSRLSEPKQIVPAAGTKMPATVETNQQVGDHVIVLVEYGRRADLVPVQRHFKEYGIETEIVPTGTGRYYLRTKKRYSDTKTPGSEGYRDKQRIIEIGALYKGKAPPGYETFAPHYFSDAYGMKIK